MISQEQAVISTSVVTTLGGYVLWTLLQNGNFYPYIAEGTPDAAHILQFLALVSLVSGGLVSILWVVVENIISRFSKKSREVSGVSVLVFEVSATLALFVSLLLHVFRIIHIRWILLSCIVVWGIVVYGKFKERNRLRKFTAASARTGKNEDKDSV